MKSVLGATAVCCIILISPLHGHFGEVTEKALYQRKLKDLYKEKGNETLEITAELESYMEQLREDVDAFENQRSNAFMLDQIRNRKVRTADFQAAINLHNEMKYSLNRMVDYCGLSDMIRAVDKAGSKLKQMQREENDLFQRLGIETSNIESETETGFNQMRSEEERREIEAAECKGEGPSSKSILKRKSTGKEKRRGI